MSNYYIMHHGVKGQHKGNRRWQNTDGSLTDAGFIHYYGHPRIRKRRSQEEKKADDIKKSREAYLKEKARVEAGGRGRKKKYNVGSQYLRQDTEDNEWVEVHPYDDGEGWTNDADYAAKTGEYPYHWSNDMSQYDIMDFVIKRNRINPEYGSRGTTQNCAKCSSAMVLCEMGYPASSGRQTYPTYAGWESYWFDGAQTVKTSDIDELWDGLKDQPDGAYGVITARYNNSGHAFNYKMKNGVACIYDGQDGSSYASTTVADPYDNLVAKWRANGFKTTNCTFTRMDQATPNWEHMAEDSVVSRRGWPGINKVQNEKDGRIVDRW